MGQDGHGMGSSGTAGVALCLMKGAALVGLAFALARYLIDQDPGDQDRDLALAAAIASGWGILKAYGWCMAGRMPLQAAAAAFAAIACGVTLVESQAYGGTGAVRAEAARYRLAVREAVVKAIHSKYHLDH